jgi:hypothetical protein
MPDTLQATLKAARAELLERVGAGEKVDDIVHEIADSHVPIYTGDILAYAVEDWNLAVTEPELGPAFDGTMTPVNLIAANIYEAIIEELYKTIDYD